MSTAVLGVLSIRAMVNVKAGLIRIAPRAQDADKNPKNMGVVSEETLMQMRGVLMVSEKLERYVTIDFWCSTGLRDRGEYCLTWKSLLLMEP